MNKENYTDKEIEVCKLALKKLGKESYEVIVGEFVERIRKENIYNKKPYTKKALKKLSKDDSVPIEIENGKIFRSDI